MKDKKILIFIISAFIIGLIFSFLFPLYQIPDEIYHINKTYDSLNYDFNILSDGNNFLDAYRLIRDEKAKVNPKLYFDLTTDITPNFKLSLPKISIIKYFPQAIGVAIGELIHLPSFLVLALGEIFALIFYIGICAFALKLLPFKTNSFIFIMLLPLSIQQMGSFSYDVPLIAMSFLFIAYILYLKFTKTKINLLDIFLSILILVIIGYIKAPYILLGLLLLILPLNKLDIKIGKLEINKSFLKKYKLIIGIVIFIFLVLGLFLLSKIHIGKVLLAFIVNPLSFIKIIFSTLYHHGLGYIYSLLANFGWHDTHAPLIYPIIILIFGLFISFCNYKKNDDKYEIEINKFKIWEIVYIVIVFILLSSAIIISLYEWSQIYEGFIGFDNYSFLEIANYIKHNDSAIVGIQGRYFIPILPLLFIIIFNDKITNKVIKLKPNLIQVIYYIFMIGYMFIIILNRYWIGG